MTAKVAAIVGMRNLREYDAFQSFLGYMCVLSDTDRILRTNCGTTVPAIR